jgi:hypothetical protein
MAYIKGAELFQDMAGWTEIKQSCPNVTAYQRESEQSDFKSFKAEAFYNKPPEKVARYIWANYAKLNMELH